MKWGERPCSSCFCRLYDKKLFISFLFNVENMVLRQRLVDGHINILIIAEPSSLDAVLTSNGKRRGRRLPTPLSSPTCRRRKRGFLFHRQMIGKWFPWARTMLCNPGSVQICPLARLGKGLIMAEAAAAHWRVLTAEGRRLQRRRSPFEAAATCYCFQNFP